MRSAPTKSNLWVWALFVGAALISGYYVVRDLSDYGTAAHVYYAAVSLLVTLSIVAGIGVHRPARPLPWVLLAGAQLVYTCGDTTYLALAAAGNNEFPNLADVFYLAQFPLMITALAVIIRRRTPGWHAPTWIDAAVLGTAATLVWWVYVISPVTAGVGVSDSALAVTVAYPVMDLLVLFTAMRLMLGGGGRPVSFRLLVGSLAAMLIGDVVYTAQAAAGDQSAAWLDGVWLWSYALGSAAALHPSMRALDVEVRVRTPEATLTRLATLVAASLLAPMVLLIEHVRGGASHDPAIALACMALFLLVLARMAGLVQVQRLTATTDGLTELRTRGHFNEVLEAECDRVRRGGQSIGVIIADADHFKHINDTHGHPAGDEVLLEISRRLRSVVRPTDTIARYGGEEFAVLAPDAGPADVLVLGERIRAAIADTPVTVDASTDSTALTVTVSVGVASAAGFAADPESLVRTADHALYDAKRDGRNRVRALDPVDPIGTIDPVDTASGPKEAATSRM